MSERKTSRIVIEFYTDTEDDHEDMCSEISDHVEEVVCGPWCSGTDCHLIVVTYDRQSAEEWRDE